MTRDNSPPEAPFCRAIGSESEWGWSWNSTSSVPSGPAPTRGPFDTVSRDGRPGHGHLRADGDVQTRVSHGQAA